MRVIDVYLAHRDSVKFIETQTILIKKYFKCNSGSKINIYGYVDGSNEEIKNQMRNLWIKNEVTPIEVPNVIDNFNRSCIGPGESFSLAFMHVYSNYILKNNHISVCIENDVFPFKTINIEEYAEHYEVCGEVRFNAQQLPDRNVMFWLGFIIFNGEKMTDRESFSGILSPIINRESGRRHWIDCGGQSYYWITDKERNIRQMVTNGNEEYNGFTSIECSPHNITNDVHLLPEIFRQNYQDYFRVLVYDDCLIHLERMGKENDNAKELWWNNCYNKLLSNDDVVYIPIGFQCTTAEILKQTNKRISSFPFDWIISNPKAIVELMSILLKTDCDVEKFVKEEFFNIDNTLQTFKQEEFFVQPQGNILFNSKYNLIFPHSKNDSETITKIIKRFERLRNYLLNSSSNLKFVFVNRLVSNNMYGNNTKTNNLINFTINDHKINFDIHNNFTAFNNLLLSFIPSERFEIIIINAVENIDSTTKFDKNITYHQLIPVNNCNLTDKEINRLNI